MTHQLKTWPQYFKAVSEGVKTFEIRSNADRKFAVGDYLLLQEWEPTSETYTGRSVIVRVTYELSAGPFAVPGYTVMSIERLNVAF